MTTTITEALAEMKTLAKRIAKKEEFITQYAVLPALMHDPLEKDGGSEAKVSAAVQAIEDMLKRMLAIRSAINAKNQEVTVEVLGETRTVSQWLTWRRDVAPIEAGMRSRVLAHVQRQRQKLGHRAVDEKDDTPVSNAKVVISEAGFSERSEKLQEILDTLDGKLSLTNAVTTVTVD